jgi:hypothetical protein
MAMSPGTKAQTSHFLNIPVDIGYEIWLYIDDSATFRSLSLTSKALVAISQQRLFNSLRFQPYNSLWTYRKSRKKQLRDFMARLVGLARNPHLLSYVYSISIQGEYDGNEDYQIHAPDQFDFDGSLQNALNDCVSQMIHVLSISMRGFQLVRRLMDALLIVLERQPIKLDMERVSLPDPSWPITTTKLVELKANQGLGHVVGPPDQVIQNLAQSSQETLRLLSLNSYDSPTIEAITSCSFPNLTSFDLTNTLDSLEELNIASFIIQHPLLVRLLLPEDRIPIHLDAVPMLTEIEGSATTIVSSLWNKRPISTITVFIETNLDLVIVSLTLKETSGVRITSLNIKFLGSPPTWAELALMVQSTTPNLASLKVTFDLYVVRLRFFSQQHRIF